MNNQREDKQFDISLYISKYFNPVLERKRVALSILLVCFLLSLIMTWLTRPEFITYADFLIEEPRSKKIDQRERPEVVPKKAETQYVMAEAEKVKSSSMAIAVLKILPDIAKEDLKIRLGLGSQLIGGIKGLFRKEEGERIKKPIGERSESPLDASTRMARLAEMHERLRVKTSTDRSMIQINVRTINKKVGPIMLKSYVDVWLATNLEDNKKEIRSKAEFASGQKNDAYQAYKKAEQEMIEFRTHFQLPAEIRDLRDVELQLEMRRIDAALEMAKRRFHLLDEIYLDTRVQEAGIIGNVTSMGPPMTTVAPTRFLRRRLILYGIIAGLILGIGIALLLDFIKSPIRHECDIKKAVHIPILGHIPRI